MEPMPRASGTSCNWRSKASRITSPNTPWATTPLDWTWDPPLLPSCREQAPHAWKCCVPNWHPTLRRSGDCNARWTVNAAPTTRRIMIDLGRIKKSGKQRLKWKQSNRYLATRRRKANRERRLAAHRKSLHGRLVHEIVTQGNAIITEKISYRARPQQFGKSVGLRAPGMFIDSLRRPGASHGRHPGGSTHASDQTVAILSRLRPVWAQAPVAALACVPLWHLSAARPLGGLSGRLSRSPRFPSLVCPAAVRRLLGRSGTRPAGSIRATYPTRERGAEIAPKREHASTPERVCPKVQAERHKSLPALKSKRETWKQSKEPPGL